MALNCVEVHVRDRIAALYGTLGPIGFPRRSVFILDGDGVIRYAHRAIAGLAGQCQTRVGNDHLPQAAALEPLGFLGLESGFQHQGIGVAGALDGVGDFLAAAEDDALGDGVERAGETIDGHAVDLGDLVGVLLGGEKIVLGRPLRDAIVHCRPVKHVARRGLDCAAGRGRLPRAVEHRSRYQCPARP